MATEKEITDLKRRHSFDLLKRPGVSGVGVEKDDAGGGYVLAVHLDAEGPAGLPDQIEGQPVRYVSSGPFRAQAPKAPPE